ncbi:hypothetical protein AAY473_013551 [Plecturocebus cupreus]
MPGLIFVLLVEMRFHHVGQTGLKLLTSSHPPALTSQSVGITGMSHHGKMQQKGKASISPGHVGLRLRPGTFSSSVLWVREPALGAESSGQPGRAQESESTQLNSESPKPQDHRDARHGELSEPGKTPPNLTQEEVLTGLRCWGSELILKGRASEGAGFASAHEGAFLSSHCLDF